MSVQVITMKKKFGSNKLSYAEDQPNKLRYRVTIWVRSGWVQLKFRDQLRLINIL